MKQSARQAMPSLSRRTFVTAAAATGAAAAVGLSGCAPKAEEKPAEQEPTAGEDPFADCELVYGCCSPECQHHLLKGYVRDGKLVKVESGEVNECPACGKGFARVEMCNSERSTLDQAAQARRRKGLGRVRGDQLGRGDSTCIEETDPTMRWTMAEASPSYTTRADQGNFSSLARAPSRCVRAPGWAAPPTALGQHCAAPASTLACPPSWAPARSRRATRFENSDYIIAWGNNPVVTHDAATSGVFRR